MELTELIQNIEAQFDDVTPGTMSAETEFQEIEEWSSLHALSIIAMVHNEYKIMISGEDIKKATTISDLYFLIQSKK